MTEAVELADRIVMLRPGRVAYDDIPVDLPRPRRSGDPAVREMQEEVLRRFDAMGAAVRFGAEGR